ncbi:Hypothetical protein FKW44_001493 [Caligus rogercresseyi]|uniref:Uncharacterized protein n=1 Tax=Caligus rogercresseyi TaxID=217165 RepID=A0A7T8QVL3_CALRO|nr:Hypothetical protein FKW44_001493 [Caligus rogercresseyi]
MAKRLPSLKLKEVCLEMKLVKGVVELYGKRKAHPGFPFDVRKCSRDLRFFSRAGSW